LGIDEQDRQLLLETVQVIINTATSADFKDTLIESLKINYYGNMRLLEFAK